MAIPTKRRDLKFNGSAIGVHFADGWTYPLTEVSATQYAGTPGFPYRLLNVSGTWELFGDDGRHYDFNADGQLADLTDRYGNAITLSYDSKSNLTGITDTLGNQYTLDYDPASGYLSSFNYPAPTGGGTWTLQFTQDSNGMLTGISGPGAGNGYTAAYTYDPVHLNAYLNTLTTGRTVWRAAPRGTRRRPASTETAPRFLKKPTT
ncbi:MAG: hypothetical protein ACREKE_02640, partial [bacterium]